MLREENAIVSLRRGSDAADQWGIAMAQRARKSNAKNAGRCVGGFISWPRKNNARLANALLRSSIPWHLRRVHRNGTHRALVRTLCRYSMNARRGYGHLKRRATVEQFQRTWFGPANQASPEIDYTAGGPLHSSHTQPASSQPSQNSGLSSVVGATWHGAGGSPSNERSAARNAARKAPAVA